MSPQEKRQCAMADTTSARSRTVTPELSDLSSSTASEAPLAAPTSTTTTTTTTATTTTTTTTPSSSSYSSSSPAAAILSATPSMCIYCFDVLIHELLDQRYHHLVQRTPTVPSELKMMESGTKKNAVECPLFITWDKQQQQQQQQPSSSHNKKSTTNSNNNTNNHPSFELRGCIGTLQPKPMTAATFQDYALTAGLRDRRFYKITWSEVSMLRVAVSLLVQFEECRDCTDWTVGVHGIVIRFSSLHHINNNNNNNNNHTSATAAATAASLDAEFSATYLPEVAKEQGWDQITAIKSLIRKAGYRGSIDNTSLLQQRIHCTRYQSSKTRMTYAEYVQATGCDPVQLVSGSEVQHHHIFGTAGLLGNSSSGEQQHHHLHPPNWNTCNNL